MYQPDQIQRRTPPMESSSAWNRKYIAPLLLAIFAGWLLFKGGILVWRGISAHTLGWRGAEAVGGVQD